MRATKALLPRAPLCPETAEKIAPKTPHNGNCCTGEDQTITNCYNIPSLILIYPTPNRKQAATTQKSSHKTRTTTALQTGAPTQQTNTATKTKISHSAPGQEEPQNHEPLRLREKPGSKTLPAASQQNNPKNSSHPQEGNRSHGPPSCSKIGATGGREEKKKTKPQITSKTAPPKPPAGRPPHPSTSTH